MSWWQAHEQVESWFSGGLCHGCRGLFYGCIASVLTRASSRSVLWLLRFPPYGERHIHTEAAARGIDPSRIIFTDVAAKPVRHFFAVTDPASWPYLCS